MVAIFRAKPETRHTLHNLILDTAQSSRQEAGVEKYLINLIDETLGHYLLIGVYSSSAAFEEHVNSLHVKNFLNAVPALIEENLTYVSTPLENETGPKSRIDFI